MGAGPDGGPRRQILHHRGPRRLTCASRCPGVFQQRQAGFNRPIQRSRSSSLSRSGSTPQSDGAVGRVSSERGQRHGGSHGAANGENRPASGARAQSDIKSEYETAKETASAYLQAVGVLTPGAISMWEWPERVVKI